MHRKLSQKFEAQDKLVFSLCFCGLTVSVRRFSTCALDLVAVTCQMGCRGCVRCVQGAHWKLMLAVHWGLLQGCPHIQGFPQCAGWVLRRNVLRAAILLGPGRTCKVSCGLALEVQGHHFQCTKGKGLMWNAMWAQGGKELVVAFLRQISIFITCAHGGFHG